VEFYWGEIYENLSDLFGRWVVGWRVVLPIKCEISSPAFCGPMRFIGDGYWRTTHAND